MRLSYHNLQALSTAAGSFGSLNYRAVLHVPPDMCVASLTT